MAALSGERSRRGQFRVRSTVAVQPGQTVWKGALVCYAANGTGVRPIASGLAQPRFAGVVLSVSCAGDRAELALSGELDVRVIAGASGAANTGDLVYAEDDGDGITLDSDGTILIGRVGGFDGDRFVVNFEADALRSI